MEEVLTFLTNLSHRVFLKTSFFTTSLIFFKSTEAVANLSTSNLSALVFNWLMPRGTFFNSSISNSSIVVFKVAELSFSASFEVSTPAAFCKPDFVS